MFNEIHLLDGRYGRVGGEKRADGNDKKITGFTITYHIIDAVKPHYSNHRDTKWDNTATTLQNQIVPQAVKNLLTTFSKTFSYLDGANIGIGLQMSENSSSSTIASVKLYTAHINGTPAIVDLGYTLYVNTAFITLDSNNNLTEASRRNLESTITHEMMHGLMMESLTAVMYLVQRI